MWLLSAPVAPLCPSLPPTVRLLAVSRMTWSWVKMASKALLTLGGYGSALLAAPVCERLLCMNVTWSPLQCRVQVSGWGMGSLLESAGRCCLRVPPLWLWRRVLPSQSPGGMLLGGCCGRSGSGWLSGCSGGVVPLWLSSCWSWWGSACRAVAASPCSVRPVSGAACGFSASPMGAPGGGCEVACTKGVGVMMVYCIVHVLGVRVMMNWSPIMRRSVPGSWYSPPGVCCMVAIHCRAVSGSSSIHVSPLKGGARSIVRLSCVGSRAGASEVGTSPRYSILVSHLPDRRAVCVVVVAAVCGIGGGELLAPPSVGCCGPAVPSVGCCGCGCCGSGCLGLCFWLWGWRRG